MSKVAYESSSKYGVAMCWGPERYWRETIDEPSLTKCQIESTRRDKTKSDELIESEKTSKSEFKISKIIFL